MRGAWIEMIARELVRELLKSLPVRGAWIEINQDGLSPGTGGRRSPCGERGLKFDALTAQRIEAVAPRAGSVD